MMKNLLVLGALVFGLSFLGLGQHNQSQNGNNQGHNGHNRGQNDNNQGRHDGNAVAMPEGMVVELPLFIGGLGLWFWSRYRSARKLGSQTPLQ